ncbi:Bestrophin, RFP-TM, chloride channel-domain-containing protein [Tirmania nivea]|nr:Bestrophin, RFP-TM, chloride channel-domain-containing protein [Tirmania nivea]
MEKVETIKPRVRTGVDFDDYFSGPCDPTRHSKLPWFLRLHGSILPKLIIPLLFIGGWATAVTVISNYVADLSVDSVLLTVLGFVVGLALSFRSSTAYERYTEGRKFWTQMILHSRNLARIIWIHADEREGQVGKEDALKKLSAINLIIAFAQSVKHKIRHEPEYDYVDLKPLINHLSTYSKQAHEGDVPAALYNDTMKKGFDTWCEYLGLPIFTSNPRKMLKQYAKAGIHHGNLPLEIMNYLSAYIGSLMNSGQMTVPVLHTQVFNSMALMLDSYSGCERILQTPLPVGYNIAISQITWLYTIVLPFQLYPKLGWITIPGTMVAAYIILGIAAIGREIENPFGHDVNDLDMDGYVSQLANDLIIMTSSAPPDMEEVLESSKNLPLWPYSLAGYPAWKGRDISEIRQSAHRRVDHQHISITREKQNRERAETFGPGRGTV